MGSLYKNGRVRGYILIFLIFASFMLSYPIKKAVNKKVESKVSEYTTAFHEYTGLNLSYKSLSPSILSNFYIKEISVTNSSGNQLLTISKTRVNYRILKLLKGDLQNGISSVVIDGINLDVTELINLYQIFKDKFITTKIEFSQLKKLIPQNIRLKNIYFTYKDENLNSSLSIKNISVDNVSQKQILSFQMNSFLKADVVSYKKTVSCSLDFNGTVTEQLENSFVNIKLNDLTDGVYKLNKLSLHAIYNENVIDVHTIQAVNPVSVGLDYNIKNGDINAQLRTEKLSPIALITMTSKQKEFKKYKNLLIDTNTIIKSNVKEKTVDYITDTQVFVPDEVFAGGFTAAVSLFGNQDSIELEKLNVEGDEIDVSASLELLFEKMQLSGFIEVPKYTLPNGNVISTEVFFDPKDSGFMAFSPQFFVGDKALTALQFDFMPHSDSYDFIFDVYDYSHLENPEPGNVRIEGSYLNLSNYIQSNISLNSVYLDCISGVTAQFLTKENEAKINKIQESLSPFMLSGDIYASTDLKSISYNVPYVLLANTKKDNQVVMFSLNGTEQNIQLNQLSLVYDKYVLEATASIDKNIDTSDLFFNIDLNSASIPYHFSGTVMPELCNITGDYGTDIEIKFNENSLDGHVLFSSIPIGMPGKSIVVSTDSQFKYNKIDGPSVRVNLFEAEGADGNLTVNPRVAFDGNITKYGARINSIMYTDLYSALEGNADLMFNVNESVFDSMSFILDVKNPITEESINVDCNISNPDHVALTKENLMKYIYINTQINANDFSLNRIAIQKNENNVITGSLNASGTMEHPYLALSIEEMSMIFATKFLHLSGNVIVEDKDLTLNDIDLSYSFLTVNDINAFASLETMSLDATGDLQCNLLNKSIIAPLKLKAANAIIPEGKFLPDSLTLTLSTDCVSGSFVRKEFPLSLSALYSGKQISFYSENNIGINGSYRLGDGLLQLTIDNQDSIYLNADGIANSKIANIDIYDVNADLNKLFGYLNFDELFKINKANLNGELVVSGSFSDPDLNGYFLISGLEGVIPKVTTQKVTTPDVEISIVNSEININNANFAIKSGETVETAFKIFMNKWSLDHIEGNIRTPKKTLFPAKFNTNVIKINGYVSVDLQLFYEEPVMEIKGKIFGENVDLNTGVASFNQGEVKPKKMQYDMDFDITLGTHASINFDPLLRCVFVPNTKINLKIDQAEEFYSVNGELNLKSGDIAYLNRSFYIKSGTIKFNPDDVTNPLVTLVAETREKDDKGQTVKITMSVDKQYLFDLVPKFTSNPPKSENDIRIMLGQIAVADSNNAATFIVAASDYALQSMIMRQAENKLRDLCNFDIFSIRTNVLQNTINLGFSGDLSKENLSIGNFLDNTTVYIGKYLGSYLYLDAMLHVTLENGNTNDITSAGAIAFHPEIGMELESPFANIRVNMAPDINALLNNQFVPSTSVTLSWKYTF